MKDDSFYEITHLDTDLWAIEDVFSSENSICYLLVGSDQALLFDTGPGFSSIKSAIKSLTSLPVIAYLSHHHFDHTGGAFEFDNISGWSSQSMINASKNGIKDETIKSQVPGEFWEEINTDNHQTKPFPSMQFVDKELSINIGKYQLNLLHTPGHSSDSICLYEPSKRWLFSGDTAYHGPIYLQFEDSSKEDYTKTIEKLINLNADKIFPGHNNTMLSPNILKDTKSMLLDASFKSLEFPNLSIESS